MAMGPTPCPMKMLSTILYSDVASIAIIAGVAYCLSNFPIFSVPNSTGTILKMKSYLNFARAETLPLTLSPTATSGSTSPGISIVRRDPNLIKPASLACSHISP